MSTGVRRVTLSGGPDPKSGGHRYAYAELHTDGSGFVATRLTSQSRQADPPPSTRGVVDEMLVAVMIGMLSLLGGHAVDQAGAWGDAVALASLICWDIDHQTSGVTAELLEVDGLGSMERVGGTRELRQLRPAVTRSVLMGSRAELSTA